MSREIPYRVADCPLEAALLCVVGFVLLEAQLAGAAQSV